MSSYSPLSKAYNMNVITTQDLLKRSAYEIYDLITNPHVETYGFDPNKLFRTKFSMMTEPERVKVLEYIKKKSGK